MMKTITILLASLFILSCSEEMSTKDKHWVQPEDEEALLKKIEEVGDDSSYFEISKEYLNHGRDDELYYYSFIMAYKHDKLNGYYSLYSANMDYVNFQSLRDENPQLSNFAMYNLLKYYELGGKVDDLLIYFGDTSNIPPSNCFNYSFSAKYENE